MKLIFSVIILLYCFGPRNLWIDSYASINALLHDELTLATQKIQTAFGPIDKSHDAQVIHQQLINKIYTESYQRIFSVVFWFALLGPVGAVLYRSTHLLLSREEPETNPNIIKYSLYIKYIKNLLDWIPTRIFAFIFALCGHFVKTIASWKSHLWQPLAKNDPLIIDCGVAAADIIHNGSIAEDGSAEKSSLALLDRAYVVTLVILALMVLIS